MDEEEKPQWEVDIEEGFEKFDKNGDGNITIKELGKNECFKF